MPSFGEGFMRPKRESTGRDNGAQIGATLFLNRLEGAIANVTLGRGPGTFPGVGFVAAGGEFRQRRNLDAIVVKGIEVDAGIERDRWSISGGYAFAAAEVKASGAALPLDGRRPAQTPRHMLASLLAWRGENGSRVSLSGRYVSGQFEDDLNAQLLPAALPRRRRTGQLAAAGGSPGREFADSESRPA